MAVENETVFRMRAATRGTYWFDGYHEALASYFGSSPPGPHLPEMIGPRLRYLSQQAALHPEHPVQVLDAGTYRGKWAIDFALAYPTFSVVGCDMNMINPPRAPPPNCTLEIANLTRLPYPDGRFDIVHIRNVFGFLTDPQEAFDEAVRVLAPGGILLLAEPQHFLETELGIATLGPAQVVIARAVAQAFADCGANFHCSTTVGDMVHFSAVAGLLREVEQHQAMLPMHSWDEPREPAEVVRHTLAAWRQVLPIVRQLIEPDLQMSPSEIDELFRAAHEEATDPDRRHYMLMTYIKAVKGDGSDESTDQDGIRSAASSGCSTDGEEANPAVPALSPAPVLSPV